MDNRPKILCKQASKRIDIIDIIKGIAILSVVMGHALNTDVVGDPIVERIRRFVYVYHLPVFFWVAGYLHKKCSIKQFLKGLCINQYLKTTLVALASFLLLRLWVSLGVFPELTRTEILSRIAMTLRYRPSGILTGALWFMTFYSIALSFYFLMELFVKSNWIRAVLLVFVGCVGVFFVEHEILNTYRINLALSIQPVIHIGQLMRNRKPVMETLKKLRFPIGIVSATIIVILNHFTGLEIELTKHEVYGMYGFYPVIFVGITFVISFAYIIEGSILKNVIKLMGEGSFSIMALHLMAFKVVDAILGNVNNVGTDLTVSPIAFYSPQIRAVYVIVGTLLPLLIYLISTKAKTIWKNKSQQKKGVDKVKIQIL